MKDTVQKRDLNRCDGDCDCNNEPACGGEWSAKPPTALLPSGLRSSTVLTLSRIFVGKVVLRMTCAEKRDGV
jgi:hypothetical protein